MKIKVGVFWLCNFDIIYDIEEVTKIFPTEEYEYKSFESSHNMESSYGLRMLSDKYDKVLLTKRKNKTNCLVL